MGIVSVDEQISSKVAPARLFKGLITDNHNLVPKIAPQFIKSAAIIQGDGGAGSIKQVTLNDDAPFPFLKTKIDELDESKFTCKYTLIEGGELGDVIKSISFDCKIEPTSDGGCISKLTKTFTLADGSELSPDEIEAHNVRSRMLFDGVEAYLLENPDVYA